MMQTDSEEAKLVYLRTRPLSRLAENFSAGLTQIAA